MTQRLRALIIKEVLQIVRDPSSILISVLLPLILLFLYGYGVSLDLNHLRLGIAMEESTPKARSLIESFTNSRYFDVTIARDHRALVDEITRGSLRGMVVIPSYFSQEIEHPTIQVIADGSEANTANFVLNYAQGAVQNFVMQEWLTAGEIPSPSISVSPRFWYNEELESRHFLLSGALAIIMTLVGSLLPALVVAREWERGTMEALIATEVKVSEMILGKVIPYFLLGMLSMAICVLVSIFFYDLPFRGSLFALMLSASLFLLGSLALGLMVSTLSKNQVLAYQITLILAFLPAYMLSGFLFEIYSMPKWIQWMTYVLPAKYFVQSLQTLFLVGDVWRLIGINCAFMAAIGALLFLVIARKTVKRLE